MSMEFVSRRLVRQGLIALKIIFLTCCIVCIITIIFEITGCTVDMFKCWQVRVIYAPDVPFGHSNDTSVSEISDGSWVDLTRYDTLENQVHINLLTYAICMYSVTPPNSRFLD